MSPSWEHTSYHPSDQKTNATRIVTLTTDGRLHHEEKKADPGLTQIRNILQSCNNQNTDKRIDTDQWNKIENPELPRSTCGANDKDTKTIQ